MGENLIQTYNMKKIIFFLLIGFTGIFAVAQNTLSGTIIDNSGFPVMGASVSIDGTIIGTLTDSKGKFRLNNVAEGKTKLLISYLDYGNNFFEVNVKGDTETGKIRIERRSVELDHTESFSDIVSKSKATVHFDNIYDKKAEGINFKDNLNYLNNYSSVFISNQGGGENDHRISVRGFGENNIGFVVNGIPVNDQFTGDIDWASWASITEAVGMIQLQKGFGSNLLNTRAVGGTLNLITQNGHEKQGGEVKLTYGSGNTYKASVSANSGLIKKRFSISMGVTKKAGNGIVDKTWHDQWSFYLGSSLKINKFHNVELFAFGATQTHGQNLRQQNIASYSKKFAENIDGYNQEAFSDIKETSSGTLFNPDWNNISTSYTAKQFRNGKEIDRRYTDFLNVSESYGTKPMVSLLWSAQWNSKLSQSTSLYYIGGNGGRTGYAGDLVMDYSQNPSGIFDFNSTIAANADESKGVLVNKVDKQSSIGGISKLVQSWNRNLNTTVGIDVRKNHSEQFSEIRDLLGGQYYIDMASDFRAGDFRAKTGDTIEYNYVKNIGSTGAFFQTEFANDDIAFNLMFGWSGAVYSMQDKFKKGVADFEKDSLLYLKSGILSSYQSKIGARYIINDQMTAYGNIGFSMRPPVFEDIINSGKGAIGTEPKKEHFFDYELGFLYSTLDKKLEARAAIYLSSWNNKTRSFYLLNSEGTKDLNYVTGINSSYKGIEIDAVYHLFKNMDIIFSGTVSSNKFTDQVSGSYTTYETGVKNEVSTNYYLLNLKAGIAPATQLKLSALWKPVKGSMVQLTARHLRDYYSAWELTTRTSEEVDANANLVQSWKIPASTIFDLNVNYDLTLKSKFGLTLFAYLNNVFNTEYIQDATDNSVENGFVIKDSEGVNINDHSGERAQVFLGLPRNFNIGARFNF